MEVTELLPASRSCESSRITGSVSGQMLSVRLCTPSAASCMASDRVGCAWTMRAMSSAACAELHRHHCFCDELRGVRADDVHAQDAIGLGVRQHLHETRRSRPALGPARWR